MISDIWKCNMKPKYYETKVSAQPTSSAVNMFIVLHHGVEFSHS